MATALGFGQIEEVDRANDEIKYDELARFAVEELKKKENTLMEFEKVVKVKQQVVAGMKYYITLEATEGGQKKVYEAVIWVKEWEDFKQLLEFKPAA